VADAARTARSLRAALHAPSATSHTELPQAVKVPRAIRQRVLRDYHTANLDHARRACEELVRDGCNTGPVPYGYQPQRIRIAPHGGRARWRVRLVLDPLEAPTVTRVFTWRVRDRLPITEIRRRLTGLRYPAPRDPHTGQRGSWSTQAVRATLRNPKYLGHQVWGQHHHARRAPHAGWIISPSPTHPALVDQHTFAAAQSPSTVIPSIGQDPTPPGD
jgi:hypothetical protein